MIVKVALKSPRELAVTEFTLSQFKALHTAPTSDMMISPTSTYVLSMCCVRRKREEKDKHAEFSFHGT